MALASSETRAIALTTGYKTCKVEAFSEGGCTFVFCWFEREQEKDSRKSKRQKKKKKKQKDEGGGEEIVPVRFWSRQVTRVTESQLTSGSFWKSSGRKRGRILE